MATVYLGWLAGPADFTRVVAIKRLHPRLAGDEHFVCRFRDEARLNACLSHPNIVQVFDVVEQNRELLIVMEYVHGVPLDGLVQDAKANNLRLPLPIVAGVLAPALHALHALHETTDFDGSYIGTVHRDFTPPNIMVTREGYTKLIDLGVAKARTHEHETSPGKLVGKLGYCSPEQIRTGAVDRRTDVFAAGIVLWELLTGKVLFHRRDNDAETMRGVLEKPIPRPSSINPEVPKILDGIVQRALRREPQERFATAQELAFALEAAVNPARPSVIADWVARVCARRMAKLTRRLETTRRCMAHPRLGAIPQRCATEKTTVRVAEPPPTTNGAAADRGRAWHHVHRSRLLALGALALIMGTMGFLGHRLFGQSTATRPVAASQVARAWPRTPEIVLLPSPPPPDPVRPTEDSSAPVGATAPETRPAHDGTAHNRSSLARAPRLSSKPVLPRPSPPRALTARPLASKPDCNPPTYLGEDGIRFFKIECL